MSTATTTSAGLESALRYLAANPDKKVSAVATKFKQPEADIWAFLRTYNAGKKAPLPVHRIEAGLKAMASAPDPRPVGAVGKIVKRATINHTQRPPEMSEKTESWLREQGAKIVGRTQTFFVVVTPELATSWLLVNHGNRNPSKAKIRRFAAAIKAGKWSLNGETVKFSTGGRLLDGQSRLKAIILAGVPAELEVRFGLPDAAQKSMDIGETRKGAHMLEMLGEGYPTILGPALKWIFRFEIGALSNKNSGGGKENSVLENMEIEPLLKRHDGIRASVGWTVSTGAKLAKMMPPSEVAFFHYVFGLASTKQRDTFFAALATGLGLTDKSPAYHLREKLTADRASSKRMAARERMAVFIKAWNAHLEGRAIGQLGFRGTGDNREAFPTIAGVKGQKEAA